MSIYLGCNKSKGKGKDVDLYSAFHVPGTPNVHTSLKLTRHTAIYVTAQPANTANNRHRQHQPASKSPPS